MAQEKKLPEWATSNNGIAAVVNGEIITVSDIQSELIKVLPPTAQKHSPPHIHKLVQAILDMHVNRILIWQDLEERARLPEDYKRNEKQLSRILEKANERFRLYDDTLSPFEVRRYYEEHKQQQYAVEATVHCGMIALGLDDEMSLETRQRLAEGIVSLHADGQSFEELARQFSQDEKAEGGGRWGWVKRKDLVAGLADVLFELEPGGVSDPLVIDHHYVYILHAIERQEAGFKPFAEVQDEIQAALKRRKKSAYIESLREEAIIKIYLKHAKKSDSR